MRSDEYCAAISRFLAGFGARFARYRSTVLTPIHAHTCREPCVVLAPGPGCVLRYLPPGGESGPKTGNIAAHRTRILRVSETRVVFGACGVAGEGGAECGNAVNPARQGSGAGPGAARWCGSRRMQAGCGYAVGRPAAIQASVPPEMLWIVKLWGFRWDSKASAALALRPPSWQIT